jgi:nucleoside-diphosphate-sugar epimerase
LKILVTGAAGFIGMHVSQLLLARGDTVVGLDNLNDYYDPQIKRDRLARLTPSPAFRFVHMDVADRPGMAELFAHEKFDRVVHLAAQAGVRYSLQNPHATSTATSSASRTCWRAAGTAACSTWCMHPAPASTAATRACRSRSTTASTTRSACTRPPRRPTS